MRYFSATVLQAIKKCRIRLPIFSGEIVVDGMLLI
jgi:hypothetical protein